MTPSCMADGDWLMIFRSFTTGDLQDKQETLLSSMTTLSSQAVGSKSFTRDLRMFKDQLAAITFVLNERGTPSGYVSSIITDFSTEVPAPPARTQENL